MKPGDDLWDRPPRRPVTCPGCGESAEPYQGKFCWRCIHAVINDRGLTQAALVMQTTAYQDRKRVSGLGEQKGGDQ